MAVKELQGSWSGKGLRVGIVVSRFNEAVTGRLLEGALQALRRCGVEEKDLTVVRVPGAFEVPLAAQMLAQGGQEDALVCLSAVIRGETPHFDYICSQITRGIGEVSVRNNIPVGYGVLTVDTVEQAANRAGLKHGNKGEEAALTALEMANLMQEMERRQEAGGRRQEED